AGTGLAQRRGPHAVRVVTGAAPELVARDLFAPALLELFDVAGDRQPLPIPDEQCDRVGQPVARTIAAPPRAWTYHADFARELGLSAEAVAAVGCQLRGVDDVGRTGARDMTLAGSMTALATDARLGKWRVGVAIVCTSDRAHARSVAVEARRQ